MDVNDLRTRLKQFAHDAQWHGNEKALLGTLVDGVETVPASGKPGWVYVRILRTSGVTTTIALNTKVQEQYNLEVWVGENAEGQLAVVDIVESDVAQQHGSNTVYLRYPSAVVSGLIRSRRFMPGLVTTHKIGGAYTMSVYAHSFAYSYDGKLQYWHGDSIDLTSNRPSTSNTHRFVLVAIDPTTNTLIAVNGVEKPVSANLGASAAREIAPLYYIPLACVEVKNGMTAIDSGKYFFDMRPLVTGVMTQFVEDIDNAAIHKPLGGGEFLRYNEAIEKWEAINPVFDPKLAPASPNALDDEFDNDIIDPNWRDSSDYLGPGSFNPNSEWVEIDGVLRGTISHPQGTTYGHSDVKTKVLPAGDFTIVTRVRINEDYEPGASFASRYYGAGLVLYRNQALLTNYAHGFGISFILGDPTGIGATQIRFDTGSITPIDNAGTGYVKNTWWYFRVRRSSSTYYFDYSEDGINWTNSYLGNPFVNAPNEVGIAIWNGNGSNDITDPITAEFDFFRYHGTFDAVGDPLLGNKLLLDIATYDPDQDGVIAEAGNADTLDNLDSTAFVKKIDYNAHSLLVAHSDDTPAVVTMSDQSVLAKVGSGNTAALVIAEGEVLGRISGGNVDGLTVTQLQDLLDIHQYPVKYKSQTSQTIPDASPTQLHYEISIYDPYSLVTNPSTNWRYNVPKTGLYLVTAEGNFVTTTAWNPGERCQLMAVVDTGAGITNHALYDLRDMGTHNHILFFGGAAHVYAEAGDDIYVTIYQNTGGNLATGASAQFSHLGISRIID